MVYYLGRDVSVALQTESSRGITASNGAITVGTGEVGTAAALGTSTAIGSLPNFDDVVGVDIGIGAMDEDISYFGMRSVTKAEIKKETTVTITMKKKGSEWDTVFNMARYGTKNAGTEAWPGLEEPDQYHGYRVAIALKNGSEVLTIPNACVQSHTVTVNADGVTEETIEFMSYVTPFIGTAVTNTATTLLF